MSSRLSAFAALNNSDSEEESPDFENVPLTNQNSTSDLVIDLGVGSAPAIHTNSNYYAPSEVITSSTVALVEGDNIVYGQGFQLIGLNCNETLILKGQYTIKVTFGSVTIDMFQLQESKELYINASNLNSLPSITTMELRQSLISPFTKPFNAVIQISNVTSKMDMNNITNLYPHLKNLYTPEHSANKATTSFNNWSYTFANLVMPEPNKISVTASTSWRASFDQLTSNFKLSEKSKTVLILGNKNTGKSTYLRLLTNYMLSQNLTQTIQILDIDPGQPEMCQPTCITLAEVNRPFVGTHDPFLNEGKMTTKFIGFSSPNLQPINYLYQLGKLIEIKEKDKNKITIINSPGWVKGYGTELMSYLANATEISFLVQLTSDRRDLDVLKEIDWSRATEIIKLESISKLANVSTYSPAIIRNYKLLSYIHFDQVLKTFDFNPLIFKSPYMLPYIGTTNSLNKLKLFQGIVGVSVFESDGMIPSSIANCLECQYAALVTVKSEDISHLIDLKKATISSKLPLLIEDSKFQKINSKFYGLCVIHSVDTKSQVINIYTPINVEELANNLLSTSEKLLLVKGKQEIPIEEMYSNQIIKNDAKYWSSFGLECLPYLSPGLNTDVVGGKTVGIRRNIQRH